MGLLRKLLGMRIDQDLIDMGGKVAAESQTMVWQLLQSSVGTMHSTPEAQAFVRVRVRRVVRHQMYRVMNRRDWSAPEREDAILNQALSILAGQYAGRLLAPATALPSMRRAA